MALGASISPPRPRKEETMNPHARTGILLAGGYGCYQAVSSAGYLTAMGTVSTNLGFVTALPFMISGCIVGALVAFAIACLSRRRRSGLPIGGLACTYLLFSLLPLSSQPLSAVGLNSLAASLILGSLRGLCTSCISLVWIVFFVRHAKRNLPILYMATFALSSTIGLIMRHITVEWLALALTILLLLASFTCVCALLHNSRQSAPAAPRTPGLIHLSSTQGWAFYASWLCLLVCEFVVGVTNSAVFNSDFSAAMAGVNMSLCMLVATGLLAVLFAALRKAPDPTAIFKGCMPVMLAVFSVMALMANQLGPLAGSTMVVCYDMLALTFSIYLVAFLRDHGYNPYLNAGVLVGVSNLTLLLGLAIGVALNTLWSSQGVPLLTLVAFVAIYPIGLALLFVQKAHGHRTTPETIPDATPTPTTPTGEQIEDYYAASVAAFARDHGLTPREAQVCALLVRGRSVKFAAQELGITENTAWTHIKNLYAKCGVGTKQDLMDLFEHNGHS